MASNNSPEWYPQFLEWWTANVKTPQDAAYGRAYYEQRLAQDKQNEQDKKAEKAQKTSDITGAGMALGVPLAYAGGKALFDSFGKETAKKVGEEGVKEVAKTLAGQSVANATPSLMQTAAVSGAPQLLNAANISKDIASPTLLGVNRIGGAVPAVAEGGGFLSSALPIAGGALGAYGMYDLLSGGKVGAGRGALQGAGSGAAIGTAFGGPGIGTAIGAGVGGLIGLGQSMFGSKERFKEEWKRKQKLVEAGILPPEALGEQLESGRSTDQLYDIEMKKQQAGQHANTTFAKSRNVADLTPKDIWGYSTPYETLGAGYGTASEQQRFDFNKRLLDEGLVREGRGQISYSDPNRAKSIWEEVLGGMAPSATLPTVPQPAQQLPDFSKVSTGQSLPKDLSGLSQGSTLMSTMPVMTPGTLPPPGMSEKDLLRMRLRPHNG